MTLAVCFHLHCYQPERADPWLDLVNPEPSAYPYHDWNQRITAECYRPNTAAAMLAPDKRLSESCDNFAIASFDVVRTLHRWLVANAPDVDAVVRAAGREPDGQPTGAALASPAVHAILPLAEPEDREVLVAWGIADFKARFGFAPEGMWLPETAVDLDTLATLARHGIRFTLLMPRQARRVRAPGGRWVDVSGEKIDPSRAYLVSLPGGESMTVVFGHGPLSRELAFGDLLNDGATLVSAIRTALATSGDDELIAIVTDGETYGHHHEFGEMALAWAARELQNEKVEVTNLGAWLASHPPTWEVELATPSSWSCAHGVERWRSDCGCTTGSQPGWNQSWRGPLREALDWLRATLAEPVATALGPLVGDPLDALVDYGVVVAGTEAPEAFVARRAARPLAPAETTLALELLELGSHLLSAFTSCAWFFADPSGIETLLSLRHVAVVLDTAARVLGLDASEGFLERLKAVRSNREPSLDGRDLWARFVEPQRIDAGSLAAAFALELAAGSARSPMRRGAWVVTGQDVETLAGRTSGTVVVEYTPTLRRTVVEVQAECTGAVSAVARSRPAGEDCWRETTLSQAGPDVAARVGAARVTGRGDASALVALRCLTASLRTRAAEADDAVVLGALVAGVAPLAARDLDAVGASLAVLRDASISKEALAALGALAWMAKSASVEWPAGNSECEHSPANH
ncbi:MAG: DUF3536 domain-containing protein [Acidimicrobiales bacterium]|jgi:hypothetical protein